jgi:hypothetical protein
MAVNDSSRLNGEVSEWPKELPWKGSVGVISPRVRIPPSPPKNYIFSKTCRPSLVSWACAGHFESI